MPDVLEQYIRDLIPISEYHVRHPPSHKSDGREWAKTEDSWYSLKEGKSGVKHVPVPEDVIESLYLTDKELQERNEWLRSLNTKNANNEEKRVVSAETGVIAPIQEMCSVKEESQPEVMTVIPPDFRKIIIRTQYSEWNRIISTIIEDYEVTHEG